MSQGEPRKGREGKLSQGEPRKGREGKLSQWEPRYKVGEKTVRGRERGRRGKSVERVGGNIVKFTNSISKQWKIVLYCVILNYV